MKTVKGDLIKLALEGYFDVIVHGANCFCKMGKGIALNIRHTFPEAYKVDKETKYGDVTKLGTFTFVRVQKSRGNIVIINAYTQYGFHPKHYGCSPQYGVGKQYVDYKAVRDVFKRIKETFHGYRIGYCKIGAGLGGGDWGIISKIIDEELEGEDHTLVVLF